MLLARNCAELYRRSLIAGGFFLRGYDGRQDCRERAYSRQRKFAPLGVMLFVAAEIINNRAVGRGAVEVVEVLILEDSAHRRWVQNRNYIWKNLMI